MSETTWEIYRDRCVAHGETVENARRTWDLMQSIKHILDDKDVGGFVAPELVMPQEARLARLFIDQNQAMVQKDDETIAAWLCSLGGMLDGQLGRGEKKIAEAIKRGEHWKWWRRQSEKS